ncbi:MAG: tRNA (adenosine(37)-N6)-threonylcarbamoyltransferase complex ATPase subunit type 1 TsaE [Hyphomicrobiaceae bacterium]|nr:tRNA (adenosine(37)-N6)-threonylcarbamoyltransferase complex ATPase subunit type 1 TsaE [Hyphomicrobiaceae bacterium]
MSVFEFEADETGLQRFAEVLILKARAGDMIALSGDLGAGKSTLARAFVRAAAQDYMLDVPSPTFSLRQDYDTPRFAIAHVDLYRLNDGAEIEELGLDDGAKERVTLIEWPERAAALLGHADFSIELSEAQSGAARRVRCTARGDAEARLTRAAVIFAFLQSQPMCAGMRVVYLQGDASVRAYARLIDDTRSLILMDAPKQPDGPPARAGKPYSKIAHLAEDVRPFVAIGDALVREGFSAAKILARDLEHGLLLVEDLGDRAFGVLLARGDEQRPMWLGAVDALIQMRRMSVGQTLPIGNGTTYMLPRFDRAALEIETELLLDWYWPAVKGEAVSDAIRRDFQTLWAREIDLMLAEAPGWFLRDYHSPNLFWLPERHGVERVGMIDFQDALAEHWAYDLVSVLQDARVDVSAQLEAEGLDRYCSRVGTVERGFDAVAFRQTYARFGLQRNTRLAGLWVRLLKRDDKPGYLQHMPRTWDYITRNLAQPSLSGMRAFYDLHFPADVRKRPFQS